MADQAQTAAVVLQTASIAARPGSVTSEFALAKWVNIVASAVIALGAIGALLPEAWTGNHYVHAFLVAVGLATKVLNTIGYAKQRTDAKSAVLDFVANAFPAELPEAKVVAALVPDPPPATPASPAAAPAPAVVPS
jgi:hypothetical protein